MVVFWKLGPPRASWGLRILSTRGGPQAKKRGKAGGLSKAYPTKKSYPVGTGSAQTRVFWGNFACGLACLTSRRSGVRREPGRGAARWAGQIKYDTSKTAALLYAQQKEGEGLRTHRSQNKNNKYGKGLRAPSTKPLGILLHRRRDALLYYLFCRWCQRELNPKKVWST